MNATNTWHADNRFDTEDLPGDVWLHHDPRWLALLAHGDDKTSYSLTLQRDGRTQGHAGLLVHPSDLRIAISDWTLYARPVRRHTLLAPPLLDTLTDDEQTEALRSLLLHLHANIADAEVLFLTAVPEHSTLARLINTDAAVRRRFHVMRYGEPYAHRAIRFGGDYAAYLAQLGANTRSDLKRTRKRFIAAAGDYVTRCYRSTTDVADFLDAAMPLSAKTYQYRQLGGGLRSRELLMSRYGETAAHGWFRSYVLFARGEPVAFQAGHLFRRRYHAQEIGYAPDWAKQQAGIFLHTEIITDLLSTPGEVEHFDFGNDDNLHKQRLSTEQQLEAYYYLIPRNLRNSLITYAMHGGNTLSTALGRLLARYGLRQRLRRALWKRGVMK